jgi:hypothetical protein
MNKREQPPERGESAWEMGTASTLNESLRATQVSMTNISALDTPGVQSQFFRPYGTSKS